MQPTNSTRSILHIFLFFANLAEHRSTQGRLWRLNTFEQVKTAWTPSERGIYWATQLNVHRIADPSGVDPDPEPTFKKNPGFGCDRQERTEFRICPSKTTRIRIRPSKTIPGFGSYNLANNPDPDLSLENIPDPYLALENIPDPHHTLENNLDPDHKYGNSPLTLFFL